MDEFLALVQAAGPVGLGVGLVVLVLIFAASKSGLVITGDQKRIANVVLSILLAGVPLAGSVDEKTLATVIASVASAAFYEFLKWVAGRITK